MGKNNSVNLINVFLPMNQKTPDFNRGFITAQAFVYNG